MDSHPECGACAPKLHSLQEREMFEYAGAAGGWLDKYGYPFCRGRVMTRTFYCTSFETSLSDVRDGVESWLSASFSMVER